MDRVYITGWLSATCRETDNKELISSNQPSSPILEKWNTLAILISLVYVSTSVVPFSKQDFLELLAKSRENNLKLGITGMLLFKDGNFLQVHEGDREKVHSLYQKITQDPRHAKLAGLFEGSSTERDFPDWSMGFHDLRSPETVKIPGSNYFLDTSLTAADFSSDPGRAKKLLLLFKENKLLTGKGAGAS